MIVYIDNDCKCYMEPGEGLRPVETDAFDGKCATFIEGHRCIPAGEVWINPMGYAITGPQCPPWKAPDLLNAAQAEYERVLSEAQSAYRRGVNGI